MLGGLIGGVDLVNAIKMLTEGAQGIMPAVLRILAAGVLTGVLMESGAASTIASGIVKKIGEKRALLALTLATMILAAVGVFVDIAVITVAPIDLAIARKAGLSRTAILLAMQCREVVVPVQKVDYKYSIKMTHDGVESRFQNK